MTQVAPCPVPDHAFLSHFSDIDGAYTDSFEFTVERDVSLEDLIRAFFSTRLFKLEIIILKITRAGDTSDAALEAYAKNTSEAFAAWSTIERSGDVILMRAGSHLIRSWLMVEPLSEMQTRLCFGSAVLPVEGKDGVPRLPLFMRALTGFHKLYSRLLLSATARKLMRP